MVVVVSYVAQAWETVFAEVTFGSNDGELIATSVAGTPPVPSAPTLESQASRSSPLAKVPPPTFSVVEIFAPMIAPKSAPWSLLFQDARFEPQSAFAVYPALAPVSSGPASHA